jgi:ElaB/YqjD/DUF883 family membrane-anchored ribosome-binding protein
MERETAQTPNQNTQGNQSFLRDEDRFGERQLATEGGQLDQVRETIEEGVERGSRKISETAHRVADRTREVASTVKTRASEIGSRVVDRTDAAMSAAGERIEHLGQSIRNRATDEGRMGRVLNRTASALEQGGLYLQESTPTDVRMDLEDVMRKRPLTTLLVGAGIGFLIARALRKD